MVAIYASLVIVVISHSPLDEVVVLTCWVDVVFGVTYVYSWSWEMGLLSPVAVYAALGDSFTSLVLDWYATLYVIFSLFFFRHTNTVIMMTAAVMSTDSVATPTPTKNDALFMELPSLLVVLKCVASVATGSGVDGQLETRFGKKN